MTRKQAIEVLDMVEAHGLADEAKKMAIEALSQEPTTVIATGDGAYYKIKACEDANENQHNSNALNDVGQHTNALEGDAISRQAVLDMWRQMICYDRTCHYRDEGRCTETFCDFKLFEYQINHMPSVNPQPCEDAISREELLKAINTWDKFGVDDTNSLFRLDNLSLPHYVPYIHYDDVVKCIKGLPSVAIPSAEPKTGHWIDNHNNTISCDYCHTWFKKDDRYGYMHYCPYCNTKMVDPQESEDK